MQNAISKNKRPTSPVRHLITATNEIHQPLSLPHVVYRYNVHTGTQAAIKQAGFAQSQGAADGGPVLLRLRKCAGHNMMLRPLLLERDAETLAFFARQLGWRRKRGDAGRS